MPPPHHFSIATRLWVVLFPSKILPLTIRIHRTSNLATIRILAPYQQKRKHNSEMTCIDVAYSRLSSSQVSRKYTQQFVRSDMERTDAHTGRRHTHTELVRIFHVVKKQSGIIDQLTIRDHGPFDRDFTSVKLRNCLLDNAKDLTVKNML